MSVINDPLVLIENTIQKLSDPKDFYIAKNLLEAHLEKEENKMIDEINDLISIILDVIEGNIINKQKEKDDNGNADINNNTQESESLSNFIIFEEVILEMLEKNNFLYEILEEDIDVIKYEINDGCVNDINDINCKNMHINNDVNEAYTKLLEHIITPNEKKMIKKVEFNGFKKTYDEAFINYPFKEISRDNQDNIQEKRNGIIDIGKINTFGSGFENMEKINKYDFEIDNPLIEELLCDKNNPLFSLSLSLNV